MESRDILTLCLSFSMGLLLACHSLRDSFAGPKVDPFCSPPDHLTDQWTTKEWKIFGIPRSPASELFCRTDPMKHNMRDYKFSECESFVVRKIVLQDNVTYTIDSEANTTCTNGYSFEDPGIDVSFVAEVRQRT